MTPAQAKEDLDFYISYLKEYDQLHRGRYFQCSRIYTAIYGGDTYKMFAARRTFIRELENALAVIKDKKVLKVGEALWVERLLKQATTEAGFWGATEKPWAQWQKDLSEEG